MNSADELYFRNELNEAKAEISSLKEMYRQVMRAQLKLTATQAAANGLVLKVAKDAGSDTDDILDTSPFSISFPSME